MSDQFWEWADRGASWYQTAKVWELSESAKEQVQLAKTALSLQAENATQTRMIREALHAIRQKEEAEQAAKQALSQAKSRVFSAAKAVKEAAQLTELDPIGASFLAARANRFLEKITEVSLEDFGDKEYYDSVLQQVHTMTTGLKKRLGEETFHVIQEIGGLWEQVAGISAVLREMRSKSASDQMRLMPFASELVVCIDDAFCQLSPLVRKVQGLDYRHGSLLAEIGVWKKKSLHRFRYLANLCKANGTISSEERQGLEALGTRMGVSKQEIDEMLSSGVPSVGEIKFERAEIVVLFADLVHVAGMDGKISQQELQFLLQLANRFRLQKEEGEFLLKHFKEQMKGKELNLREDERAFLFAFAKSLNLETEEIEERYTRKMVAPAKKTEPAYALGCLAVVILFVILCVAVGKKDEQSHPNSTRIETTGERERQEASEFCERGKGYEGKEDWLKALAEYQKAKELDSSIYGPFREIYNEHRDAGYVAMQKHDYKTAIAEYTKAIDMDPSYDLRLYEELAQARKALGDNAGAERELKRRDGVKRKIHLDEITKRLEVDPRNVLACVERGNVHLERGDFDSAIADFTKAIEFSPNEADAFYGRGKGHEGKGDWDKAVQDYKKAAEIDPTRGVAEEYAREGRLSLGKGEWDSAIKSFSNAIDIAPTAYRYACRGIAYDGKGDWNNAIADYTTAYQMDPKDDTLLWTAVLRHRDRGIEAKNEGQYQDAITEFTKAIQINPKDTEAYYERADALEKIGDKEGAERDRKKREEVLQGQKGK